VSISIVLAEDFPIFLRGLNCLLESQPDFAVLGAAVDGPSTVRMVERLQPNVLVLDLALHGLSGLDVMRVLRERVPQTRVVVLSMHSTTSFIAEALRNGAIGYVLKGCPEDNLVRAVRDAAAGRRFLSPPLTAIAIDASLERSKAGPLDPHETLTPRQREVLQMAAEGRTATKIAAALKISPRTAENHRANVMRKLGLQNQTELIRHAIRRGLLPPEP